MKFYFKNYINLSDDDKFKILEMRNSERIRKNMYDNKIINIQNHLQWIENLKKRKDCRYWAVYIDDILAGSISLTDIGLYDGFAEWGFYIDEKYTGFGAIIEYLGMTHFFDDMKFLKIMAGVLEENKQVYNMHKRQFGYIDAPDLSTSKDGRNFMGLMLTRQRWFDVESKMRNILNRIYNLSEVEWE